MRLSQSEVPSLEMNSPSRLEFVNYRGRQSSIPNSIGGSFFLRLRWKTTTPLRENHHSPFILDDPQDFNAVPILLIINYL